MTSARCRVRSCPQPGAATAPGSPSRRPTTFLATYQFDTQEAADTAAAADLGERAMNWQVQDADGNRQGLTIAEFGEAGGPGMGGCPAGSGQPDRARRHGLRRPHRRLRPVKWTPVTAAPGADPVTGYSVEAIERRQRHGAADQHRAAGRRQRDPGHPDRARPGGDLHLRGAVAWPGPKMSTPFTAWSAGPGDTTPPTLTL